MGSDATVVARAKFAVPRLPNATVRRAALARRLDDAVDCPLSLVVAAPGSGKTALLAQWVDGLDGPVAWMSCDSGDADADRFWTNVATAVEVAWPELGATSAGLADGHRRAELAIGLANELGDLGRPGVIVLDDHHLAASDPGVMRAFIGALPPGVRLVLGSRSDPSFPLGKMRLQGRLLELRQADLRFSDDEARGLLAGMGVEVSDRELEQIIGVTEGWTAAVQLAGLRLRAHADVAGLVRDLADTDRSLVDFLLNEVIDLQPADVVEFLTVTSELDAFDAALCDAVLDRHDSATMLRRVDAANLFLVELDRAAGWYRYHHLFAQFLRGRLRATAPERVPAVHRAAAEAHGLRGDEMRAVHHSMKAGDTDRAIAHLESYATGSWSLEDRLTGGATARAWLDEHGTAHLARSPQGVLACTILLNAIGRGDDAEPWLRRVEAGAADLDRESRVLLDCAWSFDRLQHGDPVAALDRAHRAEAQLRHGPVAGTWVEALPYMVVQAHLWLDDLAAATATVEAVRLGPARSPVTTRVRMPGLDSWLRVRRGDLATAERLATATLADADELGLHATDLGRAEPHLALAAVALERDDPVRAEAQLDHVMRIVEGGRRPPVEVLAHLQVAQLAGVRGDDRAAADAVDRARAVLPRAAGPVVAHVDRVDLRVTLDRGDLAAAGSLLARLPGSPATDLLDARLRLAANDPTGALAAIDRVADAARTDQRLAVEAGLVHALVLAAAGADPSAAHDVLAGALAVAEPAGFRRTVVAEGPALWKMLASLPAHGRLAAYVGDLLDIVHRGVPPAGGTRRIDLVDPLSERELTVLRYLASRLTCTEIAAELYLSVNTVRSHVKSIYRKLGVNSRAEAVGQGRVLTRSALAPGNGSRAAAGR